VTTSMGLLGASVELKGSMCCHTNFTSSGSQCDVQN